MPLSPVQRVKEEYTLTATDVVNGYAVVPVVWHVPFADANYTASFGVHDLDSVIDLSFAVGDMHNLTFEGFDAVVYLSAAIPLIQGQADYFDSTSTTPPISILAPITTLYNVTLYYGPASNAGTGTWAPTLTWTDPSGNDLVAGPSSSDAIDLGPAEAGGSGGGTYFLQSYSIALAVKGGTYLNFTGAYSGTPFPINVSIRIVQMPNNAIIAQPGDSFVVNAIGIHD
jgi:hypothetical protein